MITEDPCVASSLVAFIVCTHNSILSSIVSATFSGAPINNKKFKLQLCLVNSRTVSVSAVTSKCPRVQRFTSGRV